MGIIESKKADIIFVGLDRSGKSTMINYLKPQKYAEVEIAATVGYSIETFSKSKINFTAMDMSGQGKYRSLWEKYYEKSEVSLLTKLQNSLERCYFSLGYYIRDRCCR